MNQTIDSQQQCSESVRGARELLAPGSAREEAPPGRSVVTWPEGPGDKHSEQSKLQSQRVCRSPPPAKTLSHLAWLWPREHLQAATVRLTRVGRPRYWRWDGSYELIAELQSLNGEKQHQNNNFGSSVKSKGAGGQGGRGSCRDGEER